MANRSDAWSLDKSPTWALMRSLAPPITEADRRRQMEAHERKLEMDAAYREKYK